jgi:hypothetical protein
VLAPAPAPVAIPVPVDPILVVKLGLAYKGGRGAWYALLCQFNGQPRSAFITQGRLTPASYYGAKSARNGQPKTPESRLAQFVRWGVVSLKAPS